MSRPLPQVARELAEAGQRLAEAAVRLPTLDPGAAVFGATVPPSGALGELATGLHQELVRALAARGGEAAHARAVLQDAAGAVSRAASGYAEADDAAARRHLAHGQEGVR